MHLVIDSSQLHSPKLREFFELSVSNRAVLIDFVGMEAYKDGTLNGVFESMSVVSDFPTQVIVLKGSAKICGLCGRRKGLQRRLIDESQTRNFPEHVRALRLAQEGNSHVQRQLMELRRDANDHLDKMLKDAESMRDAFDSLGKEYNKDERAILRDRRSYTPKMVDKFAKKLLEISGMVFRDSPHIRRAPSVEELPNTFIFRVTLASYLLAITRSAYGNVDRTNPVNIRNDLVDMMFVAYGTFFDGILSEDKNVNRMFEESCLVLSGLFNAHVPAIARLQNDI